MDPDDTLFASSGDMPEKIRAWCAKAGQAVPQDVGMILRVAIESLALKYRVVCETLSGLSGFEFKRLNAGGGGTKDRPFSQATANALGMEILAGPVEATSVGSVMVQMTGTGHVKDLKAGRELIRRSFEFETLLPEDTATWDAVFEKSRKLQP